MSLVLPIHPRPKMSGVKEEQLNPESITESLQDVHTQLKLLLQESTKINTDLHGEQERSTRIQARVEKLNTDISSLSEDLTGLIDRAECVHNERQQIDDEYTQCLQDKIQLLEEEKDVKNQLQLREIDQQLKEQGGNLQANDVEKERALLEFAKEDLAKKQEDLASLEKRLEEKRMECDKEWECFKDDINRAREEKRPYIKSLQEFDNLLMSRFKGLLRFCSHRLTDADRERIETTVQNLEIQKQIAEEKEKLLSLELLSRDVQNNVQSKLLQRKAYWNQFDDIQSQKQELVNSEDATLLVKKTPSMQNLLADPVALRDQLKLDSGDNYLSVGGKSLHRCHKNTNIAIPLSEEEKNELQSMIYEGETVNEEQENKEDADIHTEEIVQQTKLDLDMSARDRFESDLGASGSSDKPEDEEHHEREDSHEDDDKRPNQPEKDVARNLLRQAEGNVTNPNQLLSKLQNRLIGLGSGANRSQTGISAGTGAQGGSGVPFTLQRLKSDSRYKVDAAFKRHKRH